jgi:Mrp family chromosome partitioning ATPase
LGPGSPVLEACRALRVNLAPGEIGAAPPPLLLVGSGPNRRCALVAAGLALALAEEGRSALVVDADLRRPSLHHLFALPPGPGFAEALEDGAGDPAPAPVAERLSVLPAGRATRDAGELLALPTVARVTRGLAERFEALVYYMASPWTSADALLLAPHIGAAVLAIRSGVDTADDMKRLKDGLERSGVRLLGFALVDGRR